MPTRRTAFLQSLNLCYPKISRCPLRHYILYDNSGWAVNTIDPRKAAPALLPGIVYLCCRAVELYTQPPHFVMAVAIIFVMVKSWQPIAAQLLKQCCNYSPCH